jgi:hypothetical protein
VSCFDIQGYEPQWLNGLSSISAAHGSRRWQVEVNHKKFDDLSITWNIVDPVGQPAWTLGDCGHPDDHVFRLAWRSDARAETTALQGQRLQAVELLEYAGGDVADGMVAVSFAFPDGRVTISNGLDENLLEFGEPDPGFHRHQPSSDLA